MKKIFKHSKTANRYENWIKFKYSDSEFELQLCDECKALGYCKIGEEKVGLQSEAIITKFDFQEYINFDIKEYINKVPVRVNHSGYGKFSKLHLQVAFDAFHQEDYETAILHFRATIEAAGNITEAFYGLTVSYFITKDYENAMTFAERYNSRLYALQDEIVRCYNNDIANKQLESDIQKVLDDKEMPIDNLTNVNEYVLQTT